MSRGITDGRFRDDDGDAVVCGKCRFADIRKMFCRVTAACIRENKLAGKCRFFKKIENPSQEGSEDVR